MTGQLKAALANREAMPDAAFEDALNAAVTQNHLRARPISPELVAQMNLDKSLAFYKDRFADASDFTFVFVGSFDLPTIKPLVERYLGSLPALHRKETGQDVGIRPPAASSRRKSTKGIEPKSQVGVVFTGPFQNNQKHRLVIRAMANTLEGSLQRVAARGPRRHVRRQRACPISPSGRSRNTAHDHVRLRSGAHRGSRQGAVCGDRRVQAIGPERQSGRRRAGRRCAGISKPTAGRTATC